LRRSIAKRGSVSASKPPDRTPSARAVPSSFRRRVSYRNNISDASSLYDNGKVVELNLPVDKIAQCGSVIVLVTIDPGNDTENENLYAYDADGTFLWRGPDRSFPTVEVCPYIDVERIDDEHVRVWDYYGVIYRIEARTGNVVEKHWGK